MKLLSSVTLILAIFLFPPASLALVSNNAVPGDATYPIKRGLEDGIYAIASLNPITRAWFSAARSDRRFKEITILLGQGRKAGNTLSELVVQTEVAANQIAQITNQSQKEQLINQLSTSIEKYDQGLSEASKKFEPSQPTPVSPQPEATSPTPQSAITPRPTILPSPKETPRPQPTLSPSPTPVVVHPPSDQEDEIDEARDKLEKIKKKLEEERKKEQQRKKDKEDEDKKKEDREDKDDKDKEDNKRDKK